jgi:hypothetical protein
MHPDLSGATKQHIAKSNHMTTSVHPQHSDNKHSLQEKCILDSCMIMVRFQIHFHLVNCPLQHAPQFQPGEVPDPFPPGEVPDPFPPGELCRKKKEMLIMFQLCAISAKGTRIRIVARGAHNVIVSVMPYMDHGWMAT